MTAAFTGLAVIAGGATPVIVDVEPDTLTMDRGRVRRRAHAADDGDGAGAPLRPGGRHDRARRHRRAPRAGDRRGLLPGAPGDSQGRAGRHASALPARSASTRRRTSARSATAAPSSPTMPRSPNASRRLRNGGQADTVPHVEAGVNSRLDEVQAAVLRARSAAAGGVDRAAPRAGARVPHATAGGGTADSRARSPGTCTSFPGALTKRDALSAHLAAAGIETLIHYPVPLLGPAGLRAFEAAGSAPSPSAAAAELLSLPLHPRLVRRRRDARPRPIGAFVEGHSTA